MNECAPTHNHSRVAWRGGGGGGSGGCDDEHGVRMESVLAVAVLLLLLAISVRAGHWYVGWVICVSIHPQSQQGGMAWWWWCMAAAGGSTRHRTHQHYLPHRQVAATRPAPPR